MPEVGKGIKRRERGRGEGKEREREGDRRKILSHRLVGTGRPKGERGGERWETFREDTERERQKEKESQQKFSRCGEPVRRLAVDLYSRNVKYSLGRIPSEREGEGGAGD